MKYIQENNLIQVICYKIILLEHFCPIPKKNYFVFKNTMDLTLNYECFFKETLKMHASRLRFNLWKEYFKKLFLQKLVWGD